MQDEPPPVSTGSTGWIPEPVEGSKGGGGFRLIPSAVRSRGVTVQFPLHDRSQKVEAQQVGDGHDED